MNYSRNAKKILFVCFADSSHSQSWIDLLKDSDFDVRVFAYELHGNGKYPPLKWSYPTYTLINPNRSDKGTQVKWVFPSKKWWRPIVSRACRRFDLVTHWLRRVIRTWKPDIIHSLSLEPAGILTGKALEGIPEEQQPFWVISTWGSDINLGIHDQDARQRIERVLRNCDGLIADCRRDIRQSIEAGLHPDKVAVTEGIPVTGGLNVNTLSANLLPHAQRNCIIVPKAYEEFVNKTLPIIEAFILAQDVVLNYDIHLFMCSREVQSWLRVLPESIRQRCYCHSTMSHEKFMDVLEHSRVMIATSLSDGTPNVMLEAMAVGALPIMSPLESIKEWIDDGRNGLLAHALHPNQIAEALRKALTDEKFCDAAAIINRQIISKRANRENIRPMIIQYYINLLAKRGVQNMETIVGKKLSA